MEEMISFAIGEIGAVTVTAVIVIQFLIWYFASGRIIRGEGDREDVLILVPMAWIPCFIWITAKAIPKALRTPPKD